MLTDSSRLDFDGQIAIVTGAGRGIGSAHAHALAERGAAVVITDLPDHRGISRAHDVAEEITNRGGQAIAYAADVSDPASSTAAVELALERFGGLDVVLHNAGLTGRSAAEQQVPTPQTFANPDWTGDVRQIEVNLLSAFYLLRAAWPVLLERRYGRVLLTSSGAVFGTPALAGYGAAKAGLLALARCAALDAEGTGADIKVNALAPMAATALDHARFNERFGGQLDPAACTAAAVVLTSRECPINGECIRAGGGVFARIVVALSSGWTAPASTVTAEAVLEAMPAIVDPGELSTPRSADALIETMVRRVADHG